MSETVAAVAPSTPPCVRPSIPVTLWRMEWHIGITLGTMLSLLGTIWHFASRFGKLELQVVTLWDFHIRRGAVEATKAGGATVNSPLRLTDLGREWLAPLAGDLQAFYRDIGSKLNDRDLYIEIERRFGDRLLHEVCMVHGLHAGACIVLASLVAREQSEASKT